MASNASRAERTERAGCALLDAGEGRRLERFGDWVVDRPAPTAVAWRRAPDSWNSADLRFDGGLGWLLGGAPVEAAEVDPWTVEVDGLTMELRLTTSGGVGLYPEHRSNLAWLERQIGSRLQDGRAPTVLNLFAHTGLATLAAARAGAAVTHVDGARGVVAWARRNAELSGLADRPIRWIVDDAAAFVAREARRGRSYDGMVIDPPSFGHAKGRRWHLEDELPRLLDACRAVATDDAFALLTAHTTGLDGSTLERWLGSAFPSPAGRLDGSALKLEAESGARLDLGWSVRLGN